MHDATKTFIASLKSAGATAIGSGAPAIEVLKALEVAHRNLNRDLVEPEFDVEFGS